MKIVHELYNKCQIAGGSVRPYAQKVDQKELPKSGYVDEILIVSPAKGIHDTDDLRIEGDLQVVVHALETALSMVKMMAQLEVDENRLDPNWYDAG